MGKKGSIEQILCYAAEKHYGQVIKLGRLFVFPLFSLQSVGSSVGTDIKNSRNRSPENTRFILVGAARLERAASTTPR